MYKLENDSAEGNMDKDETFMFNKNTTAEAAYHNGTSSSLDFFEFFIILSKLELYHGMKLHLIHVAGIRMNEQGTYRLPRGNKLEGVMRGVNMLNFLPMNESALCG